MSTHQAAFLYRFYVALRRADFPLGIDDYHSALQAVEAGFGLADQDALYRLCCLLWLKTEQHQPLFKQKFNEQLDLTARASLPQPAAQSTSQQSVAPAQEQASQSSAQSSSGSAGNTPLVGKTEDTALNFEAAISKIQFEQQAVREVSRQYLLKPTNLPVSLRQMTRMWHYLRRYRRNGPATELDVEATVRQTVDRGYFLKPVLVPRRTNQVKLLLLLDHGRSMVPFHLFSRQLVESAQRGGRVRGVLLSKCAVELSVYRSASAEWG